MREIEMTGKTVELAVQAACDALGVDRDDINVSYEVLDFPVKKLFKSIPARVRVTVEEPEAAPAEAAPVPQPEAAPAPAAVAAPAEEPAAEPAAAAEDAGETPLDIAADARLQAAVDMVDTGSTHTSSIMSKNTGIASSGCVSTRSSRSVSEPPSSVARV